jgi:hypothetical protein
VNSNQIDIREFYDHDARIRMVEKAVFDISETLKLMRLDADKRFDNVDKRFEYLENKIDRQFTWTIGLIIGLYASGFITLLGYFLKTKGFA